MKDVLKGRQAPPSGEADGVNGEAETASKEEVVEKMQLNVE